MPYEIKPLSPDLAETFAEFLGSVDFSATPHWASCYCRSYYLDCPLEDWMVRTGEQNRAESVAAIQSGEMTGYLAFEGARCVGWCSANDVKKFLRIYPDIQPYCDEKKVGCTICYVVHPDWRQKGVARALLSRAIEDFTANGYDAMIAVPFESKETPQKRYRGTLQMYLDAGYREIAAQGSVHMLWLDLRQ
ncbi:MAG: GNAT family N-acetyltransferase [Clostridiaceae bacterium]